MQICVGLLFCTINKNVVYVVKHKQRFWGKKKRDMIGLTYILTAISWICLALLVLTIFYLLYATPCSIITHSENKFMALNDNITEQWALTVGNRKRLIKRQLFAEWLDGVNSL